MPEVEAEKHEWLKKAARNRGCPTSLSMGKGLSPARFLQRECETRGLSNVGIGV